MYLKFTYFFCFQSCIVAIVVPDVDVIKCWALENRIPGTLSVLCNNPDVKQLILQDMLAWGKECGLSSFEQVRLFINFVFLGWMRFFSYLLHSVLSAIRSQHCASIANRIITERLAAS